MTLFRFTALALIFAAFLGGTSSYAAEQLHFTTKDSFKNAAMRSLLESFEFSDIAGVDLNEDGIEEFILKQQNTDGLSQFRIVAFQDGKDIELGLIEAKRIMISHSRHHGIRSILAYHGLYNDYDYDVHQWDTENLRYINARKADNGGKI